MAVAPFPRRFGTRGTPSVRYFARAAALYLDARCEPGRERADATMG